METFDQVWESSRNNYWSWAYLSVLWSGAVILVALSAVNNERIRFAAKVLVILCLPILAFDCAAREIQETWRIRREWARMNPAQMTPANQEALTHDGANLTLGPVLYGVMSFMWFVFVAAVLSAFRARLSRIVRNQSPRKHAGVEPTNVP